jgi:diketogulonate reductase-like aldo/keto reductase
VASAAPKSGSRGCGATRSSIVGALKTSHIDDAIAALSARLTDEEAARLEAPYTPRRDTKGSSDPAVLTRRMAAVGNKPGAG